jgi:DNA modification methylase/ParB-like chromosome segregation protein Spo0J
VDLPIQSVKVGERVRKDFGDIEDLASSLARVGLLNPIIVDANNNLLAGHRRLLAAMHLGWETIDARLLDELDEATRREVELEENIRRKDLTWPEEVIGLLELYTCKQSRYGKRTTSSLVNDGPGFGVEDAAKELDRSIGSISMDLQLARGLAEFPDLAKEKSKTAAFKRYRRLKETQLRAALAQRQTVVDQEEEDADLAERLDYRPDDVGTVRQIIRKATWRGKGMLYCADSRDVLPMLDEGSIDLIVTDPPYGLDMFRTGRETSGQRLAEHQGTMYDDEPTKIMDVLDQVFMHAARVLKPDGHAYVFFHMTRYEGIYLMLRKHFGHCDEVPIIWIKNTPGIGDPNQAWTYAYEPCFWINRGRSLMKPQAFNYLKYDTVSKKIHGTQKPVPLLRHLIQASSVPGEVVLDPFAGSGSTCIAAAQLGCRFVGIESHEPFHRSAAEFISTELALVEQPEEIP